MQSTKKIVVNADNYQQNIDIQVIGNKLNELLNERKVTTKVLSEATGVSIAAINNIKRAEGNPTIGTLSAICKFFSISLFELLGLDHMSTTHKPAMVVPIFDLRFANQRSEESISSKMLLEIPANTQANTIFGITINNNSLLPLYEKGTIFILTSAQVAVDGDITLVRLQNHTNALKRLFIKKDNFYVKNINMDEQIEAYDKEDIEILGIVLQIIQNQYNH